MLADKGYASKANRQCLQEQHIGDLIQHNGSAGKLSNKPLKNGDPGSEDTTWRAQHRVIQRS